MMDALHDTNIWLSFSFVIFLFILFRFGKDAVIGTLDGRIESIKKELETAESLRIEAQEMLAQYQRKHRDALQEAEKIVENAEMHASEIRKNSEKILTENMERREAQLKERLKLMEESAVQEIREYAANLAIEATSKIIESQMNKKDSDKLIDDSIQNISKNLH